MPCFALIAKADWVEGRGADEGGNLWKVYQELKAAAEYCGICGPTGPSGLEVSTSKK